MTQARLDIKHLAALANYFEMNGIRPQNRSHLVYASIGLFHDLLADAGKLEPVASAPDAVAILAAKGIEWSRNSKGHRQLIKLLQEDHRLMESLNTIAKDSGGLSRIESEIERILNARSSDEKESSGPEFLDEGGEGDDEEDEG